MFQPDERDPGDDRVLRRYRTARDEHRLLFVHMSVVRTPNTIAVTSSTGAADRAWRARPVGRGRIMSDDVEEQCGGACRGQPRSAPP